MNKSWKKNDDFFEKYSDYDLETDTSVQTDWEGRSSTYSSSNKALTRYLAFLTKLKYVLMCIFALIILTVAGLSFKFLLFTKFEVIVFDDGTDVMCIYDPQSGEMKQNAN